MNDYAYEKRALVQVEPKKAFKAKTMYRFIAVLVLIVVAMVCFYIFLSTKESSKGSANSNISEVIDFNNMADSYTYGYNAIQQDFGNINFVNGINRLFIKEDALCVQYPRGGKGVSNSGAQINTVIEGKKEYYMEYEMCFDGNESDFDWQEGGMLSGLAGGQFYNGTEQDIKEDGFNAMLIYNNYGYLYPCVYSVNDANVGGNIYQEIGKINEGSWSKVKMYVKLNDISEANGVFKVWLDDKLCFNNNNIRFITKETDINISNVQAYNNCSAAGKGTAHEEFVYLDNIKVY